jgi:hypothetical protein
MQIYIIIYISYKFYQQIAKNAKKYQKSQTPLTKTHKPVAQNHF